MTAVNNPTPQKPDVIDWKNYDMGGFKPMPPPGPGYQLKLTKLDFGEQAATNPTRNKAGYLQVTVEAEVVAPGKPYHGAKTSFNRFSTKKWTNRNGSPMGDLLRAAGSQAQPVTDADYVKAVQALVGQVVTASLKWEIYDQEHNLNLNSSKHEDQFAVKDGVIQPYVLVKSANGESEKIYANTRIGFLSQKGA